MMSDWSFLFNLVRAVIGAVFLLLGIGTVVTWREAMREPQNPAVRRPAWVFPALAIFLLAAALAVVQRAAL